MRHLDGGVTITTMPDIPQIPGLPPQLQLHLLTAVVLFKFAGQLYSSVTNGGGLRAIILRFWLGTNLPKEVAADYQKPTT